MNTQRKKKKNKFGRLIFLVLLLTGAILGVLLYAPVFNINEIAISGNEAVGAEEIKNSSGIIMNTNIFKISKKRIRQNLMTIPLIDEVNIKRKLPRRIILEIKETYPRLIIPYKSGFIITDEKWKILSLTDDSSAYELTTIKGIKPKDASPCRTISAEDEVSFEIIDECVKKLNSHDALNMFRSLNFSNITNFYGYTKDGVRIIFGKPEDMDYKLSVLDTVLSQITRTEGTYVDLTIPSATVTGKEEPKEEEEDAEEENESPEASAEPEDKIKETEEKTAKASAEPGDEEKQTKETAKPEPDSEKDEKTE